MPIPVHTSQPLISARNLFQWRRIPTTYFSKALQRKLFHATVIQPKRFQSRHNLMFERWHCHDNRLWPNAIYNQLSRTNMDKLKSHFWDPKCADSQIHMLTCSRLSFDTDSVVYRDQNNNTQNPEGTVCSCEQKHTTKSQHFCKGIAKMGGELLCQSLRWLCVRPSHGC